LLVIVGLEQSQWGLGLDPARSDVDARREGLGEGHQNEAPVRRLDVEQVAGPVILDAGDGAEQGAIRPDHAAADQVGMQELVLIGIRRELLAGDEEFRPVQRLGLLARRHALESSDDHFLGRADIGDFVAAALAVGQRAVTGDPKGIAGESLDPDLAAHAMRRADDTEQDEVTHVSTPCPALSRTSP